MINRACARVGRRVTRHAASPRDQSAIFSLQRRVAGEKGLGFHPIKNIRHRVQNSECCLRCAAFCLCWIGTSVGAGERHALGGMAWRQQSPPPVQTFLRQRTKKSGAGRGRESAVERLGRAHKSSYTAQHPDHPPLLKTC